MARNADDLLAELGQLGVDEKAAAQPRSSKAASKPNLPQKLNPPLAPAPLACRALLQVLPPSRPNVLSIHLRLQARQAVEQAAKIA
jgi:hypothetical protein